MNPKAGIESQPTLPEGVELVWEAGEDPNKQVFKPFSILDVPQPDLPTIMESARFVQKNMAEFPQCTGQYPLFFWGIDSLGYRVCEKTVNVVVRKVGG